MAYTLTACDDGSGKTVGTIVRFDSVTLLIDPAWNSSTLSYSQCVKYWSNIISEVDIILLSQPNVDFLGAYSLLYYNFLSHFISRIEVYSTLPIANIGRVSTIDLYASKGILGPYETSQLELEDIEKSFDHITSIKYSQLVDLRARYDGLSFVAYSSGVNPGGTIWNITSNSEKILYTPQWNHTKDTILPGSGLIDTNGKPLSTVMKPSAIITNFEKFGSITPYRKRSHQFRDFLKERLKSHHSIMIPVDLGGKLLDLLVQINDFFYENSMEKRFHNIPIFIIAYSRGRILTYARSMLEWLSASILQTWSRRDNLSPFDFKNKVEVISPDQLSKHKGQKICFVSDVDILIDEVISKICTDDKMTILLTNTGPSEEPVLNSLNKYWLKSNSNDGRIVHCNYNMTVKKVNKRSLKGKDLESYTEKIQTRREQRKSLELQLRKEAKMNNKSLNLVVGSASKEGSSSLGATEGRIRGEEEEEDDDEDDDEDNLINMLGGGTKLSATKKDIPIDIIVQSDAASKHSMFPFTNSRIKKDDYGTISNFDMLIPKEESNTEQTLSEQNIKRATASKNSNDEEDGYYVEDPSNTSNSKKRKLNRKNEVIEEGFINIDNIDYLKSNYNPQKISTKSTNIQLKCFLTFINLNSLVDKRSTTIILPNLKPRNLILLGSDKSQDQNIKDVFLKRKIPIAEMKPNKPLEFNTTVKMLDISIDPELESLLNWQKISDDNTIAHLLGRLVKEVPSPNTDDKKDRLYERTKYVLKPLNDNRSSLLQAGSSLAIGDIRLTEIKRKLALAKHKAEFRGEGILVVDGRVVVRKVNDGETVVDGTPSALYDLVKQLVTDMLATI
ncbi:hypothetical protein TBLA_0A03830 [Henningerozyma blattae CBS 6284]|uniref:Cleavage and polyadenylation specificity factor subunit 2 n=1 Tax=Henningerozyma blattae (strain ATCC 34711 / CBS 6284 / DSM 70876 / NBRC 10599 / NRRL Y-10934 / UCD 77-7) TaxID=1071380 RepID=I2GVM9_HENB6|nr:hypothetical protein TBLA_0A03830 [Tetrapisispora blattae CBS 6284]CCH58181.1 hypothetical protein TBLA_0A03830 [Tetrapisispora blattae CBS 6284]